MNNLIFYKICIAQYVKKNEVFIKTFAKVVCVNKFSVLNQFIKNNIKDQNIINNIYLKNNNQIKIYYNIFKKMNDHIFLSTIILF